MRNCERIEVRKYIKSEFPRLKWSHELHERFIDAVHVLGGKYKATPKRIMQMMNIKGLKISHIKSHLQMYRNSREINGDIAPLRKHLKMQNKSLLDGHEENESRDWEYKSNCIDIFSEESNGVIHTKSTLLDCEDEIQDSQTSPSNGNCELSLGFTPASMADSSLYHNNIDLNI